MTKYYLIKDDSVGQDTTKIWVENPNGRWQAQQIVELTEEDMGALEIACDSIEAYNKECANKIRKVLKND